MKIEKVNDYQIRCTLTREDLASRKLKISELAYGTKKGQRSFQRHDGDGSFRIRIRSGQHPAHD